VRVLLGEWVAPLALVMVGMIAAAVCGIAMFNAGGTESVFPLPFARSEAILMTREQYIAIITWTLVGRATAIIAVASALAAIVVAVVRRRCPRSTHAD